MARHGLAFFAVVVFACTGATAGPARSLQSLRLVVSVACLHAPQPAEQDVPVLARPAAPTPDVDAAQPPRRFALGQADAERWLFQRPPPAAI